MISILHSLPSNQNSIYAPGAQTEGCFLKSNRPTKRTLSLVGRFPLSDDFGEQLEYNRQVAIGNREKRKEKRRETIRQN